MSKGISTRAENYAQWYNDIVIKADMAEHSDVRGCMVINHTASQSGEAMKEDLDHRFRRPGMLMHTFHSLFPRAISQRRLTM